MERLPESLFLEILSRLDSADVARSRLVSTTFDSISRQLTSIKLQSSEQNIISSRRPRASRSNPPQNPLPFKSKFLKFAESLRVDIKSVDIINEIPREQLANLTIVDANDLYNMTDDDFLLKWLNRYKFRELKSLSIASSLHPSIAHQSHVLSLVSMQCHNLLELKLKGMVLSLEDNLMPRPMVTSLTFESIALGYGNLNVLNEGFPNLEVLNLIDVGSFGPPTIDLQNLKACHWEVFQAPSSFTLITPNLITFRFECRQRTALHLKAPRLHEFHLVLDHPSAFTAQKFENLQTLLLESLYVGSLISKFPVTETMENLTVDSLNSAPREAVGDDRFTLGKVFTTFPNVSSLCIRPGAWLDLEARYNPFGWETWNVWDGRKGFTKLCAYLTLADVPLTFTIVSTVLNQCIGLSEVSFLIHRSAMYSAPSFSSKCRGRWRTLKWRWGLWREGLKDYWVPDNQIIGLQ